MASDAIDDVVLRKSLPGDLDGDISRTLNSSKANRSGTTSSSSKNARIQVWDDRELTHSRHLANR